MNGFVITGKILDIEKKITRSGSLIYRMTVEDNETSTISKPAKKFDVKVVGNQAKTFNEHSFRVGVNVLLSGVLDSYDNKGFTNLSLTALCVIPVAYTQTAAYRDKEINDTSETISEIKDKQMPDIDETGVSEDDLPF